MLRTKRQSTLVLEQMSVQNLSKQSFYNDK